MEIMRIPRCFIGAEIMPLQNYQFSGIIDSSGIKFHITPYLRKFDAGIIELGLEYTDKMAIPPGQDLFSLSGYCVTECTAVVCIQ